jgi:hypothetical protein
MTFLLALSAVLFWSVPSFAGKTVLSEDELDQLTAAGQPTVIQASGTTNTITLSDTNRAQLVLGGDFQAGLKALTVNNTLGENEVSSLGNIASSLGNNTGKQENTINQSWGSVLDVGFLSQNIGRGGTGSFTGPKCVFGPCSTNGTGASNQAARLSKYADVIIEALATTGNNTINVQETPNYELDIGGGNATTVPPILGAQDSLAALIVNNVAGRNLVANAINISAGAVDMTLAPSINSAGSAGVTQTNVIRQYRGSPLGFATRTP